MKLRKIWIVEFESETVEREFIQLFRSGEITVDDNKVILKWIDIIEEDGSKAIKNAPFWHDHALDGDWIGHRSSSFSSSGRIIYKIVDSKLLVSVVRVSPDHNYKR
jgi:mRNA-degrading endonuclease YafQ of YafQ-DinJ toxin-antitoxin module